MSDPWHELLDAVSQMRHAQREFFRTHSTSALHASKAAEKKVDELCAALKSGQQTLFEDPRGLRRK
jgi:hypothetical protein